MKNQGNNPFNKKNTNWQEVQLAQITKKNYFSKSTQQMAI
jgi:hypothetical protein